MSNYCKNIFIDISTDGYYVALNASNIRYLTFNDHPNYHKINNLRYLTIIDKISKKANYAPYKCYKPHFWV